MATSLCLSPASVAKWGVRGPGTAPLRSLSSELLGNRIQVSHYYFAKRDADGPPPTEAGWTRRSKGADGGKSKSNRSWKQRSEKFLMPFQLDVYISGKYVNAKIVHRVTSRVVAVATTSAKELRNSLPSLVDVHACRVVGKTIADRAKEADVYAVVYRLRKGEKYQGKLAEVVDTMVENGILLV